MRFQLAIIIPVPFEADGFRFSHHATLAFNETFATMQLLPALSSPLL